MIIDCISDLHGYKPKLTSGDILIISGDLTAVDTITEHSDVLEWIHKQNYRKKVVVAGNHDSFLKNHANFYSKTDIDYLCDSAIEFQGLKIWGSPWTTTFPGINPHCCAFTVEDDEKLSRKWDLIPDDTDILITHCPPHCIFDLVKKKNGSKHSYVNTGSISLRNACMGRVKPKIHVFGHIHECGGKMIDTSITKFINASYVNEAYKPLNKPIRIEI